MSTLANITSLNLSLQTGGAALAVNAVKSVAKPERVVYVFGTADDVAPNFTTIGGAITYAESLTPTTSSPVVVRLFTDADGVPYNLDGDETWTNYAIAGINIQSDYQRLNETTILPETLPAGLTVWYIDPNGVETLWVGREDGSAWPAVGYKEYVALLTQTGTNAPVATVLSNTLGTVTYQYNNVGQYQANSVVQLTDRTTASIDPFKLAGNVNYATAKISGIVISGGNSHVLINTYEFITTENVNDELDTTPFSIRVYP
jgi:hypothetical protein